MLFDTKEKESWNLKKATYGFSWIGLTKRLVKAESPPTPSISSQTGRCSAMWNKQANCPRCGTPIRRSSNLCRDCYAKERPKKKVNHCADCGKAKRGHRSPLCRDCANRRVHLRHVEECEYTLDEYNFMRSWGITHDCAVDRLSRALGVSPRGIDRRIKEASSAKEQAA